jgi:hypothetical protein
MSGQASCHVVRHLRNTHYVLASSAHLCTHAEGRTRKQDRKEKGRGRGRLAAVPRGEHPPAGMARRGASAPPYQCREGASRKAPLPRAAIPRLTTGRERKEDKQAPITGTTPAAARHSAAAFTFDVSRFTFRPCPQYLAAQYRHGPSNDPRSRTQPVRGSLDPASPAELRESGRNASPGAGGRPNPLREWYPGVGQPARSQEKE